jgi:coenzyme F420-dependent glucose-6-phosphate dehydrogenase
MSAENGEVIGADTVKKTGCFSNDPKERIQYIQQHIELGFDTIIVHSAGPDQKGFIESYARDILPHVRSAQARTAMAHTH